MGGGAAVIEWLAIVALFVAVNIGMILYVRAYNRNRSEYQKAYDEARAAIDDVKVAIGEELEPVLGPLVRWLDERLS